MKVSRESCWRAAKHAPDAQSQEVS